MERNTTERNIANATVTSIEGIEPVLTISEAAVMLRWSVDSVRRYFQNLPGVLVKVQPKRYTRQHRRYKIPLSVFRREWDKMAAYNTQKSGRAA